MGMGWKSDSGDTHPSPRSNVWFCTGFLKEVEPHSIILRSSAIAYKYQRALQ